MACCIGLHDNMFHLRHTMTGMKCKLIYSISQKDSHIIYIWANYSILGPYMSMKDSQSNQKRIFPLVQQTGCFFLFLQKQTNVVVLSTALQYIDVHCKKVQLNGGVCVNSVQCVIVSSCCLCIAQMCITTNIYQKKSFIFRRPGRSQSVLY